MEWIWFLVRHILHKDQGELPRFQMESQVHGGVTTGTATSAAADKSQQTSGVGSEQLFQLYSEKCQHFAPIVFLQINKHHPILILDTKIC